MEFLVTRADNTTYSLPSANSKIISGEQNRVLMGEDTLSMVVESVGYINFQIGDWIEAYGYKYTLNTLGEPERLAENRFKYSLKFEGVKYELTKVVYRSADYTGFNPSSDFSLTGNVENFLTVLQYNLERAFGVGTWAVGSFPATDAKTLSFASENCLLVLNRLCEEFDTEYEIITVGGVNTISIQEAGSQLPFSLEYGKGKGLYSLVRTNVDSKNVITRLYVEGSDKNIKVGYRENSLRLRIAANTESYIDSPAASSFGIIEGSKIFDDIFPHREGTVSAIQSDKQNFVDTGMDFDLNETDVNGTKWLIAGQSAKIHFNTGNLAGYAFDLVSYNHSTKTFRIKSFQDERGLKFPNPDSAAFQVGVGDKYVILDIIMPQVYITAAETELATKGQEYLTQNDQPRVEYALSLDRFYLKDTFSSGGVVPNILNDGDFIHILDSKIGVDKNVRVKSFTRNLIDPFTYSVTLSDVIEPTRIERLISDTTENKKAAQRNKLFNPARSRRNWRDIEEVTGMVDTLRAEMALIGTPEGQFQASSFFEVNKNGNPNLFGATAGVLIHDAYEGGSNGIWNMGALEVALSQNQPYYLYAQCSRTVGTGVFTVSLTKIGVEDNATYYHFPVGLISSVRDDARTLTTIYGYTLISGNNITTGIIQNDQSGIMINLQTGEIRGAFTFSSGQLVETAINGKNTRYTQGTDPAVSWTTLELQQAHVNDIWAKILTDSIEEYYYTEITAGVYGWILNETEIDGGRIKAGTIDASRIDVEGLFAEEIYATNFNLEKGRIGAFEVDTILRSENSEGKGIYINPAEYEISIENKSEGFGVSSVNMRAGSLTPYLLLTGGTSGTYRPTVDSNYIAVSRTSVQLRATGGNNLPALYMGKNTTAAGLTSTTIPLNASKIPLIVSKNYSVDLRYLFNVRHSGQSANGKVHKLQGHVNVSVTATLLGVTAGGVTRTLSTSIVPLRKIERSDQRTGDDIYPITVKTSFSSQDCIYAYWKLDVNLSGDLTYQRWSNDWGWKYYWETRTDWAIEFRHQMGALSSFFPSVGVTELTTSGFQTVWATNRYFRIDGEDAGAFIRSAGVWMHNGYNVATENDINTITADLTNYVLINDLQAAYWNKTEADGRFALKAGAGTQDFAVKNLTIYGTVNHWLADVITVDDARLQLNRTQGAATVASGLDIFNGTSVVSSLLYDTSGIWLAGGQRIYTDTYKPLADNATALGGVVASDWVRRTVTQTITAIHSYSTGININNSTLGNTHFGTVGGDNYITHLSGKSTIFRPYNGTTHLASVLRVHNSGIDTTNIIATGDLTSASIRLRNASGIGVIENLGGGDTYIYGGSIGNNKQLIFGSQGTSDIGFFTLTPQAKFHVNSNVLISGTSTLTGAVTAGGNVGTSNFVSQAIGWRITPAGQADFRHIYTDELQAKAFTADISQALVGSDILTKSVAKLAVNFTVTANGTTPVLYVEEIEGFAGMQVFAQWDLLRIRIFDRTGGGLLVKDVWVEVAAYVSTTNNVQRFNVNMINNGGVSGSVAYAGSMVLDYGQSGDGVIERTVLDAQGSPYSRIKTWVGNPWTPGNYTIHYQSGNLDGLTNSNGWGIRSENTFLTGKILAGDLTKVGSYMEYANGLLKVKGRIEATEGLIGGLFIDSASIGSNIVNSSLIGMVSQTSSNAIIGGTDSGLRRGFGIFNYDAGTVVGGFKLMRMGMLTNKDATNTWPATPNYGFQIGTGKGAGYRDVFRVDNAGAFIAGINFDDSRIYTANYEFNKDGSGVLGGVHLANNGLKTALNGNRVEIRGGSSGNSISLINGSGQEGLKLHGGDITLANIQEILNTEVITTLPASFVSFTTSATKYLPWFTTPGPVGASSAIISPDFAISGQGSGTFNVKIYLEDGGADWWILEGINKTSVSGVLQSSPHETRFLQQAAQWRYRVEFTRISGTGDIIIGYASPGQVKSYPFSGAGQITPTEFTFVRNGLDYVISGDIEIPIAGGVLPVGIFSVRKGASIFQVNSLSGVSVSTDGGTTYRSL